MIQRDDNAKPSEQTINPCGLMLRGARPAFIPVEAERDNHLVRGLIQSKDEAHRATLAYEQSGHKVRLTVILALKLPLCEQTRTLLDRVQGVSAFSRFDPEGLEPSADSQGPVVDLGPGQPGGAFPAIENSQALVGTLRRFGQGLSERRDHRPSPASRSRTRLTRSAAVTIPSSSPSSRQIWK